MFPRIDVVNLFLLVIAATFALVAPFEVLLFSYAFLGPLHYLTEISWLHDRKYFTLRHYDPHILVITSLATLFLGVAVIPAAAESVWLLLVLAFCTAFITSWTHRFLWLAAGLCFVWFFIGSAHSYALAVLIPTVLHVFVFTALFMFFGALKTGSLLGKINALVFVLGGLGFIFMAPKSTPISQFAVDNYVFFTSIGESFSTLFNADPSAMVYQLAAFLAFAYTYHYLNWFSKTSIIEWHKISKYRLALIVIAYMLAIGVYMYDYTAGFILLLTLSFLHVVLEFPLNFRSIRGIYEELLKK